MPFRLAALATHPIQYQAHWFRAMAAHPEIDLEVLYCHRATAEDQARAGFNVAFEWDSPLVGGYRHRFLKNVSRQPSPSSYGGLDTPEIGEILRRERFDAVLICGWYYRSAWQARTGARAAKTPAMMFSDSNLNDRRNPLLSLAKMPVYRWFIPRLDACLAAGTLAREYFLHYGAKEERIFNVPHSVDEDLFRKAADELLPDRTGIRRGWGLSRDSTVFLFAAKFLPRKEPMDFMRAIETAARTNPAIEGLMAGDGPLHARCRSYAEKKELPVRFAGFLNQSEMARAYIASDALVLPSSSGETWGLVVNEAMSCGRSCIVSNKVGCAPNLVRPGETGYTFRAGDVMALASRIGECANDRDRLEEMGNAARNHLKGFSTAVAVEGVLSALRHVRSR